MFIAIHRAQLDVFWAHEPSTVTSNLSRLRRDYIDSTTMFNLGERVLPYLPSHKVDDKVGIIPGVMMLEAPSDQGTTARMCSQIRQRRRQHGMIMRMMRVRDIWEDPQGLEGGSRVTPPWRENGSVG